MDAGMLFMLAALVLVMMIAVSSHWAMARQARDLVLPYQELIERQAATVDDALKLLASKDYGHFVEAQIVAASARRVKPTLTESERSKAKERESWESAERDPYSMAGD